MGDAAVRRVFLLSLFGRLSGPFPVPVDPLSAVARRRGQGRPVGRRATRLALDRDEHGRRLFAAAEIDKASCGRRPSSLFISTLAALAIMSAATPTMSAPVDPHSAIIDAAVDEAAIRFGIPHAWIYAVMRQESGGQTSAISAKGAIGLLQLMPSTWRDLTLEFGLGDDPFEPRANILAGAAYMRRMYDRFGAPGFLAAYNFGPERYARSLVQGSALPLETQNYLRKLAPVIAGATAPQTPVSGRLDWRTADVFVERRSADATGHTPQLRAPLWPPMAR